ncbi:hypothetical protein CPB83DRAFT_899901 [Crepidotus variabilis]|uniref:Uncharacterized protein n=1 Tax=Crepidotus variabilis TaxID=179855 RepID=A0A9P6JIJ9_9AGAR|nr:hypothetical protein CPB83DRAFT_899901 [Crepidotus variabilis]
MEVRGINEQELPDLTAQQRAALSEGFKKLDDLLHLEVVTTGKLGHEIIEDWDSRHPPWRSLWAIYESYFHIHMERELSRVEESALNSVDSILVARCYTLFKESNPQGYPVLLREFDAANRPEQYEKKPSRPRFRQHVRDLRIMGEKSRSQGIETGFVTLDPAKGGWTEVFVTEALSTFFYDSFELRDKDIMDDFSAHCGNEKDSGVTEG